MKGLDTTQEYQSLNFPTFMSFQRQKRSANTPNARSYSPQDDISSSKIREEGHDSELVKHREVAHYLKAYNLLVACTCGGRWEGKECECGTGDNEEIEDRDDYKDYDASEDKDSEESNKDGNSANDDN